MKKRKLILALTTLGVIGGALGLTSCGGGGEDPNALKIMVVKLGYGTNWLKALAEDFTAQTGTKVDIKEAVGDSGLEKISGELFANTCNADVYMTRLKTQYAEWCNDQKNHFVDLTDIYNEPYEGENGATMYSKMDPIFRDYNKQNGKYYAVQWSTGFMSFARNLDVWNKYMPGVNAPRTTEEFFEVLETLKTKISEDTEITAGTVAPVIFNAKQEYYSSVVGSWFYQYEGNEMMQNFYDGKDSSGDYDPNGGLYDYAGQEVSLKFLDRLLNSSNGYHHPDSDSSQTFTTMQINFVRGAAAFCLNGTWMEHEIGESYYNRNIDFIKLPMISAITDRLSFKSADDKENRLRELVSYVDSHIQVGDNSACTVSGVTSEDIEIVREARNGGSLVKTDQDHQVVITPTSDKIDVAKKFVKFMYSDRGLQIYTDAMKGHRLPATPTVGYKDQTVSKLQSSIDSFNNEGKFNYYEVEAYRSKIYSYNAVKLNFSNGLGTSTCIKELLKTGSAHMTPETILLKNRQDIANRWVKDIAPLLG